MAREANMGARMRLVNKTELSITTFTFWDVATPDRQASFKLQVPVEKLAETSAD